MTPSARLGLNLLIYPSQLASPGRLKKLARSLQQSGMFSETHIVGVDSTNLPPREVLTSTISIRRIKGALMSAPLGALRILLLWQWRVYRAYKNQPVSAVAAQNLFVLPMAHALAKRTGAVFAYNAHELETETIASRGLRQRIQRIIERHYIHKADVVSVVNESIASWYSNTYPGVTPVVVTNSPADNGRHVDIRKRFSIPDEALVYMHVGYITWGRNVPLILEAFKENPQAHVVFLGDGALRSEVEEAARTHGNIHWHPAVPPEEVVAHMRGADIGLNLIEHVSLSGYYSTPNKMMESLAAGIPPLSTDLPEARRFLGDQSDKWILSDARTQLSNKIRETTVDDVNDFKRHAPAIPSWDSQAVRLVSAYESAMHRNG